MTSSKIRKRISLVLALSGPGEQREPRSLEARGWGACKQPTLPPLPSDAQILSRGLYNGPQAVSGRHVIRLNEAEPIVGADSLPLLLPHPLKGCLSTGGNQKGTDGCRPLYFGVAPPPMVTDLLLEGEWGSGLNLQAPVGRAPDARRPAVQGISYRRGTGGPIAIFPQPWLNPTYT